MAGLQVSVTVTGQAAVQRRIARRSGRPLFDTNRKSLSAAGVATVPIVKGEAPVLSGATRDSVSLFPPRPNVQAGGPTTWYKHFVIKGTRRGVKPNPWVSRGARKARTAAATAFKSIFWWDIRR